MTILLLDAGNSRIKYRVVGFNGDEMQNGVVSLSAFDSILLGVAETYVSFVGGVQQRQSLVETLSKQGSTVKFILPTDIEYRLKTAYIEPKSLGIDRWLAIYAVMDIYDSYVVVDSGTALTIDVVQNGQHRGGFIVPGYRSQLSCLHSSAALPLLEGTVANIRVGRSTQECIERGVWRALAGMVNSVAKEYIDSKLILTGGDASELMRVLDRESYLYDNLVLDGLKKFYMESRV